MMRPKKIPATLLATTVASIAFLTASMPLHAQEAAQTSTAQQQPPRLLGRDSRRVNIEGLMGYTAASGTADNLSPLLVIRANAGETNEFGRLRLRAGLGVSQSRILGAIGGYFVFMGRNDRIGLVLGSSRAANLAPNTNAIQVLPVGGRLQFANGYLQLEAVQAFLTNNSSHYVQAASGLGIAAEINGNRFERNALSLYIDAQAAATYAGGGSSYVNHPGSSGTDEPTYTIVDVTQNGVGLYFQGTAGISFPLNPNVAVITEVSATLNRSRANLNNLDGSAPNIDFRNFDYSAGIGLRVNAYDRERDIYEDQPTTVDPNNHTPHPPGAAAE